MLLADISSIAARTPSNVSIPFRVVVALTSAASFAWTEKSALESIVALISFIAETLCSIPANCSLTVLVSCKEFSYRAKEAPSKSDEFSISPVTTSLRDLFKLLEKKKINNPTRTTAVSGKMVAIFKIS